ncbi:MAG: formyltetrahydrofolate deformylase [Desulfovibrionaceae bacterium]
MSRETTARLLITCADRPGIVSAVTQFLFSHGANITGLDQHSTDPEGGELFMRLEFQTPYLDLPAAALEGQFQQVVADRLDMKWRISYASRPKRIAVLVSKYEHCLMELLWRNARGELPGEIAMVVSNHPDLEQAVTAFGVPYHHVPVKGEEKAEAEAEILRLFDGGIDVVVLARYMQILSGEFLRGLENRVVNIHHSFLPAFAGGAPYKQAFDRGVKIIGATAHYVTEELDAGPIIAQDVARVCHRHNVAALKEIGRDLERRVLARAVIHHLEDRIIVHGAKTVVFDK